MLYQHYGNVPLSKASLSILTSAYFQHGLEVRCDWVSSHDHPKSHSEGSVASNWFRDLRSSASEIFNDIIKGATESNTLSSQIGVKQQSFNSATGCGSQRPHPPLSKTGSTAERQQTEVLTLITTDQCNYWTRQHTLAVKKELSRYLPLQSLVAQCYLGIQTPQGTTLVGVKFHYTLDNHAAGTKPTAVHDLAVLFQPTHASVHTQVCSVLSLPSNAVYTVAYPKF